MMIRTKSLFTILLGLVSSMFFLAACSNSSDSNMSENNEESNPPVVEETKVDPYEELVNVKNEEIGLTPIELTSYSEQIGVTLSNPIYNKFAVNGQVVIEGAIEKFAELKSDYAWIKVHAFEEGPAGNQHEYYTPIVNGEFTQAIHFFNGEGEYRITVQLPSVDRENYYYDTATFEVVNVNPELKRDVSYTPFGHQAELSISLDSSFVKEEGVFSLQGSVNLTNEDTVMLRLNKDSESWKHVISVKDGQFSYDVPLFFGEGIHELEVLVPDKKRDNYFQTATVILVENESDLVMKPITFYNTYLERGVTLASPTFGGEEVDETYRISGTIDPSAEFAAETTHLYVTTKLGDDEALEVIPVENYSFDGSFHLRFGPGTYTVNVSVPEIKEKNSNQFRYFHFVEFEVDSKAIVDKRNILPSRGIQSEAPEIIQLAEEITKGIDSERDKAKAVYEYVAKNVSYDVEKFKTYDFHWDDSALKTLELKTGVCQDYAYLAIALFRSIDMEARFVEGYTREKHAWVEVSVNGDWLTMDPTWGAGYVQGDEFVAQYRDDYFDPNQEEFEKTHSRTGVVY
ncbi:transglutaminase domain-containing protein [Sutcliffiella halmapala]|uniref:transglutaminase domain-containing protein n=1 Tax=Sutcliffiella halmapala TaxID=79882 RepID=UPI001F1B9650|nr:transglutaminase-like domain-containing protein [Sutcliffiella halmapala]